MKIQMKKNSKTITEKKKKKKDTENKDIKEDKIYKKRH